MEGDLIKAALSIGNDISVKGVGAGSGVDGGKGLDFAQVFNKLADGLSKDALKVDVTKGVMGVEQAQLSEMIQLQVAACQMQMKVELVSKAAESANSTVKKFSQGNQ